jgi:hypothetical protein
VVFDSVTVRSTEKTPSGLLANWLGFVREYVLRFIRTWIARRLGLSSEAARDGDWWEIDLIVVILAGAVVLGAAGWFLA